nr:tyrosine-type recombinase/integrase [Bradyrhizobium neotropicale]
MIDEPKAAPSATPRHGATCQLLRAGVDAVTISKRLGHATPDITLRIYAHLFRKDDGRWQRRSMRR